MTIGERVGTNVVTYFLLQAPGFDPHLVILEKVTATGWGVNPSH